MTKQQQLDHLESLGIKVAYSARKVEKDDLPGTRRATFSTEYSHEVSGFGDTDREAFDDGINRAKELGSTWVP